MRKNIRLSIVMTISLIGTLAASPVIASSLPEPSRVVAGPNEKAMLGDARISAHELIVRFQHGISAEKRARLHNAAGARVMGRIPERGLVLVRVNAGTDIDSAMRRYAAGDGVVRVEPNLSRPMLETVPSDPYFGELWGLRNDGQMHAIADPPPPMAAGAADADIDASDAWDTTTGSPTTVVAVLDTGADLTHPDLAPSLWENPGEIPGNGVDDEGNGFIDDVNGWDFADDDAVPQDLDGHGSHVTGTIAAAMDGVGVVGICPGCRVMVLRFGFDLFTEVAAIDYAIDNGAQILNGSFGGAGFSIFERKAFVRAEDAGILSVIAAGNDAANQDMFLANRHTVVAPTYPNAFDLPGVISVAASNDRDEYGYFTGCFLDTGDLDLCAFSNIGHDSVDLAAPGVDVLSTVPGGYAVFDGTSMAAPHVAGVAGLVKSLHPDYTALQLRNALMNSVDQPASLFPGFTATDGRLNAAAALNASTGTIHPTSVGNIATATPIRTSKSGSLSYPSNVNDVFRKNLQKGDRYEAVLEVPSSKDFDLWVWTPGTLEIYQLDADCLGGGFCKNLQAVSAGGRGKDEVVQFKARKTGTYYFQVASFFSSGSYLLHVVRV